MDSSTWVFFCSFFGFEGKEIALSFRVFGNVETLELLLILSTGSLPWVHLCSRDPLQNQGNFFLFFFLIDFILKHKYLDFQISFWIFGYPLSYLVINLVCRSLLWCHYQSLIKLHISKIFTWTKCICKFIRISNNILYLKITKKSLYIQMFRKKCWRS